MTVSNVTAGVVRYGNGVTTEFHFTFEAADASHIKVAEIVGPSLIPLAPANYVVALGVGGGTVTISPAPATGKSYYIYRETPQTQLVSVSSQNRYDPQVAEEVWDRLTYIAQELQAEVDRAVKTKPGDNPDALLSSIATSVTAAAASAAVAEAEALAAAGSAAAADADAIQTAADRVQTGLDRVATGADKTATNADAIATAADRVQTGLDRTQTGLDKAATAADRAQTTLDKAATAADKIATAADRVQTGLDKAATAADRVQTALDRAAAAASAAEAASYVPTVASKAEAEAGTDNTKLMTPLRTAEAIAAQSRGLKYVASVAAKSGSAVLITGLEPGKQYRFVFNRLKNNSTAGASLQFRASENGGSTFRTGVSSLSAAGNYNATLLRGHIDLGPASFCQSLVDAVGSGALFIIPWSQFMSGGVKMTSDLVNAVEFSWSANGFADPASGNADEGKIHIFEVQ